MDDDTRPGAVSTRPQALRPRLLTLLAIVAVVAAVAAVAGVAIGGLSPATPQGALDGIGPSAASGDPIAGEQGTAFPSLTIPPPPAVPATSVRLLDADALRVEIQAVKTGTHTAHDVVVDVGAGPVSGRPLTTCADGQDECQAVAALSGFDEAMGTILVRTRVQTLPPPATADDLKAPLALHIAADGSLELLGHVDLVGTTGRVDTAGLRAATGTAANGHVVAVMAWLQSAQSPSCGPMMPDDVPNPFLCPGEASFLADAPVNAVTIVENPSAAPGSSIAPVLSGSWHIPDTAVRVGAFDYSAFAPSPTVNGMAGASRQGLYLVRMVAVDNADCQHCRGWLTVGRLDANASATAENTAIPYDGTRIHTPSELEAALQKDRDAWVGKAVLVDGSVTSSPPGDSCDVIGGASSSMCILGALDGTREDVYASGFTAALANPDSLHPRGTIALRVLAGGLEYLGRLGNARDPDFQVSPDVLAASIQQDDVLQVFVVDGYLGTSGAVPCPLVPGSPPPENTPFQRCPWAWLGPTAASGHTANEVFLPADAVQVQFEAYRDFAPGATAASFDPKFGTYLVRLVTDTRQGANGARGWQVVARLAP